jgi:hypothetical protein
VSNMEPAIIEAVKANPDVIITGGGSPSANAEDARRIDDSIGPRGQPSTSISLGSN